ncbi:hypothetical protein JOF56_002674 [Kibdelosporangium banguiense]|uniref:YfhO family protein n=1 Tax=Kibdelosporangium banguiense TaxID=1365924 RepID=A0ABS4TCY4_9PSEU|nr:hypothetical protein [Kibdelosporangium banguiense]MBP2322289.1 hypothetical protein [Kibdelosporangium banguiense]
MNRRWVTPLVLCVFVALVAQIPLLHDRFFYIVDDSAAQFVPMWRRIGEQLLSGHFPLLDLDSWVGGNIAGEALFGVWNPVNLIDYLLVTRIDDLGIAAAVVKTQFLVIIALGVYLLCREYGAAKWAAFGLAVALPFSGFILYFQASTWAAGLMTFAWVPYVWWSARKVARGTLRPVWAFVFGVLCVTAGNPYGILAILVIYVALLVEFRQMRLVLVGMSVLAVAPLVFLPLLGAAAVGARGGMTLYNAGEFTPRINDLLALSMPSHLPQMRVFDSNVNWLLVPATYFAWFAVPVLAWLDWGVLRQRRRELTAVFVITGTYLVFCLAPSHIWMFRWPIRNIENLLLGVSVLLAVLLSAGLRTDFFRRRALITGGALLAGMYLSVSTWPKFSLRHAVSLVVLVALTSLLILAARRGKVRWQAMVLAGGTAGVLLLQTTWMPANYSVTTGYPIPGVHLPYQGTVAQVADVNIPAKQGVVFGNGYAAAGVPSLMAYTGVGYVKYSKALCQQHWGTCREGYDKLFAPVQGNLSIADLTKVETVVVQRKLVDPEPRPGWHVESQTDQLKVFRRDTPLAPGRVSASHGATVDEDIVDGNRDERVRYHLSGGRAELTFARLNWPGYRAEVNGKRVPVREGPAGVMVVDLPEGVESGELRLSWTPPGFLLGIGSAIAGLALALALSWRREKRPHSADPIPGPDRESPHRTDRGREHQAVAG